MHSQLRKWARRYLVTLRKYLADLADNQEAVLEQAYKLGRAAFAGGLGVLDMVRVHQQALEHLGDSRAQEVNGTVLRAAETFFLEFLSPFEATHRGFSETHTKLRQLIETLEQRNIELARSNRALGREINQRKRTEQVLRESEEHFRELFEEARRMEDNLRHLSNQILCAQEEERKHISRELHDEVGQSLTAISVTLATLKSFDHGCDRSFSRQISEAQGMLQGTMETVHGFARELRPTMLDELGLLPALRSYLQSLSQRTGLRVQFHGHALAERLSGDQKTVLFRVAQESLTNVVKHARASEVVLAIGHARGAITMEVTDNGKSFRPGPEHSGRAQKRLGLLGMQERVRLVNGRFTVIAEPGKGTTVRVVVPLKLKSVLPASKRGRTGGNGAAEPPVERSKRSVPQP